MNVKNISILTAVILVCLILPACFLQRIGAITIIDAKIATAVDENLIPIKVTDVFPEGTSKVSCWLKWRNAKVNTQILARWHYKTDDIHILDYSFTIPKKEGMGSVALSMPNDKPLPSGFYKLDLMLGKRILKSLKFKIE